MVSGISGGVIARIMDKNLGTNFVKIDHDDTFFGDPTKLNGFLIKAIAREDRYTNFQTSI